MIGLEPVAVARTPRDVIHTEGTAHVVRFRDGARVPARDRLPVLLVPSLINRWYVLDLRPSVSLAKALVERGFDVYCLDWGAPNDEDRYLDWAAVLARLRHAVRAVRKFTGAPQLGLLGYCIGGTLSGIHTALEPDGIAALVNLAGPFDFSKGGLLAELVDPRWFDAEAIASAGNLSAPQMQSGFVALRPTAQISKWLTFFERAADDEGRDAFLALEGWASDNVAFPAAAYATYIGELYQRNLLVKGDHHVAGRRVDLGAIRCPVLSIVADRDTICPPDAATALNDSCGAADREVLTLRGGHVGAVVGSKAPKTLYPALSAWLSAKLVSGVNSSRCINP